MYQVKSPAQRRPMSSGRGGGGYSRLLSSAAFLTASRAPTQHLAFLGPGRGALLRVTADGDIQLFSAVQRRLLTSTWLQGDAINAVALLDPYILLGCESGSVRVVALLDADGAPAPAARPAADLALQPYQGKPRGVCGRSGAGAVQTNASPV